LRDNEPDMADACLDHLRVEYDDEQRWIVMYRGSLAIACNLGIDVVDVPVTGEMVLAWGDPDVDTETTRLQRHSFAILRVTSPQAIA
jgi:maltooligosyltrehalose trehalohydrolase